MMEYDFLKAVGDIMPTLQNLPMPVVAVDLTFYVHWSNNMARQLFAHITRQDGMRSLLSEFDLDSIRAQALRDGCCTVSGALPLGNTRINFTPLVAGKEPVGLLATLSGGSAPLGQRPPDLDGGAARTLSAGLRRAVGEVFNAMDAAAFKADIMDAGWIKPSLVQAEYFGYRILRTADNVAEYAALQSGGPVLFPEAVDIVGLLQELSGAIQALANGAGIPVSFSLPQQIIPIQLDRIRFDLILFNLLHNALYYTKPGNQITVEAHADTGGARIAITDQGLGIPAAVLPEVLRPFYSYLHDGGSPTTGLGLTLAERLTNAHGGKLWLESAEGKGTQVTLWLPGGGFSSTVTMAQDFCAGKLADRFSRFYTGLGDIAASPFHTQDSLSGGDEIQ